jgi:light-regulated signal transduction histidine kinase (bacteriophytochrome)
VSERTRQLGESNAELQTQVAHRRRIEELLRARNDELKAFAYTVSHDLKAPLRGIAGYGQELDRRHLDGLGERARFCVKQIITAARNLENLIEDLLAYSRLDAEAASTTEVNLPAVVDSILRERARIISDQGVEIEIDIGCPTLRGWQRGLRQVLANLIDNAIKYSRDSKPPRVRIAAQELAGVYHVSVSDNGIGFDLKYKDRIFGLFNRLVRAEEFEGTGAGLAIVRKLVEEQGGRVWPESTPGAGATFFVELPKQQNQGG